MGKNRNDGNIWWVLFGIFLAILTFSLIDALRTGKQKKEQQKSKTLEDAKVEKQKRLKIVEDQISKYKNERLNFKAYEKKVFLIVRIIVGLMLIAVNGFYFNWDYKLLSQEGILTFNASITLGYSFMAFIVNGSIQAFVNSLKNVARKRMIGKTVLTVAEYKYLLEERMILKKELELL